MSREGRVFIVFVGREIRRILFREADIIRALRRFDGVLFDELWFNGVLFIL